MPCPAASMAKKTLCHHAFLLKEADQVDAFSKTTASIPALGFSNKGPNIHTYCLDRLRIRVNVTQLVDLEPQSSKRLRKNILPGARIACLPCKLVNLNPSIGFTFPCRLTKKETDLGSSH